MKKLLVLVLLAAMLCNCTKKENDFSIGVDQLANFKPTIVLMHPTVGNLKTFISLTEQNVFPFPKDAKILGVYHTKGTYDYTQSHAFLKDLQDKRFALLGLSAELSPENIYTNNGCSEAFRAIFENSKGIIFFGGPDMPPATYGLPTNLLTEITDAHRHYIELSFQFHLLGGSQNPTYIPLLDQNLSYSVVGFCLGMQTMNVATGGNMIQDIPTELFGITNVEDVLALDPNMQHRNYHTNFGVDNELVWGHLHQIRVSKQSSLDTLNGLTNNMPYIWSSHHQAVSKLGMNIEPIAWSVDGKIVEAIKHSKYPRVLGVQFHPEVPSIYDASMKLKRIPFEESPKSYIDLYPAEKGENFHRALWRMVGEWYK
jgi:putative glutamine amidotransferase